MKQTGEQDAIQTKSVSVAASAHYYLRMPKIDMFLNWGVHQPFLDYRINPDWISAHVQSCKLEPEDAKMDFSRTW